MTTPEATSGASSNRLRLWPGVLLAALTFVFRYAVPAVVPETSFAGYYAGLLGGLAIVLWWLFASKASRRDRWSGATLIVLALLVTPWFLHESVATFYGGTLFLTYAVPLLAIAFVGAVTVSERLTALGGRVVVAATIVLCCAVWIFVRSTGTRADGGSDFEWRWKQTAEERLLAEDDLSTPSAAGSDLASPGDGAPKVQLGSALGGWPGFRGPGRDGVVRGSGIATDWFASPPVELWRQPVGPGWSSFAVRGGRFYTQEQRGESEVVSCYDVLTGERIWAHADAERFWEAMSGAGPRATPTLAGGRVVALGATGILNVLDATTGTLLWSRNVARDTETQVPAWGIAGSPWVTDDLVVAAVSGRLAAYDLATGEERWTALEGLESYSSPQQLEIDGTPQVLLSSADDISSLDPATGELLWQHEWTGLHSLQPALTGDGDLLVSTASNSSLSGQGLRRLSVSRGDGSWQVKEEWSSRRLKPYFNDFVVHEGYAYGFDGRILASIDLETGERNWKGGRYGNGQLLLLADQDLLLVLSEQGEIALVPATPESFTELTRAAAIEGKTWNHPVLVKDLLLVRNDREMAAYRLPTLDP